MQLCPLTLNDDGAFSGIVTLIEWLIEIWKIAPLIGV